MGKLLEGSFGQIDKLLKSGLSENGLLDLVNEPSPHTQMVSGWKIKSIHPEVIRDFLAVSNIQLGNLDEEIIRWKVLLKKRGLVTLIKKANNSTSKDWEENPERSMALVTVLQMLDYLNKPNTSGK